MAESTDAPWPILGHGAVVAGLWRAASQQRLPHTLLFQGARGIGKFRAARALAQGLLCERGIPDAAGPCGTCGSCKRFLAGGHPDFFTVEPDLELSEELTIDRIVRREGKHPSPADEFVALRPMEGGWRVLVIREAERLNEEAQNALLKMLEEPGRSVLWILESSRPGSLLPTVKSRCVAVRFEPLAPPDAERVLARQGLPADAAALCARWSNGSPGVAKELFERGAIELRALVAAALTNRAKPLDAARAAWLVEGEFEGKTPSARARARARTVLDLALAMLRDVARLAAGIAADTLPHGDLAQSASELPSLASRALHAWQFEELCTARADIDLNLDAEAALERAFAALGTRDLTSLFAATRTLERTSP